ncbi:MAG: hypothetical protein NXI21_03155 [Alphaproteobacteria bacterium]|nr:hypothetical protein [Alphaproteobacteria bacterium]
MQETDRSAETGRVLAALGERLRRAVGAAVGGLKRLDRALRGADRLARLHERMLRDIGLERVDLDPAAPTRDQTPQAPGAPARRSLIRPRR